MKRLWDFLRRRSRNAPQWRLPPASATPPASLLAIVGRIQGVQRTDGYDPKAITVTLAYTDPSNGWCYLQMPFLDAMALLMQLRAMQEEVGFYLPDDPYAKR